MATRRRARRQWRRSRKVGGGSRRCGSSPSRARGKGLVEMLTGTPTEQMKSLVDEAAFLRGRIVTAYCQVEFLLADISVKLDLWSCPRLTGHRAMVIELA